MKRNFFFKLLLLIHIIIIGTSSSLPVAAMGYAQAIDLASGRRQDKRIEQIPHQDGVYYYSKSILYYHRKTGAVLCGITLYIKVEHRGKSLRVLSTDARPFSNAPSYSITVLSLKTPSLSSAPPRLRYQLKVKLMGIVTQRIVNDSPIWF